MNPGVQAVIRARADASAARALMTTRLAELRARAAPKALAQRAVSRVARTTATAADDGLAFVERRPVTVMAVLAAALLIALRVPIADAISALIDKATRRDDPALDDHVYSMTPLDMEDAT